jgi:WD40 repeat protein
VERLELLNRFTQVEGSRQNSSGRDNTLRVWDLATGETKTTLQGHTSVVHAVAVTPDSRYLISGSRDNTLRVWDLTNVREIIRFTLDTTVMKCSVAQDNGTIVAGEMHVKNWKA